MSGGDFLGLGLAVGFVLGAMTVAGGILWYVVRASRIDDDPTRWRCPTHLSDWRYGKSCQECQPLKGNV